MFSKIASAVNEQLTKISKDELFTVDFTGDEMWEAYMAAFPEGTNPIFRTRREYECNCCKQFIRGYGNVVAIRNGKLVSIWNVDTAALPHPFDIVIAKMRDLVEGARVATIFRTSERAYGKKQTFEPIQWDHFYGQTAARHLTNQAAAQRGEFASRLGVFTRALREIKPSAVADVLELIDNNVLYRGSEHRAVVAEFQKLQRQYDGVDAQNIVTTSNVSSFAAVIRNTAIGTLLCDLSVDGTDLDKAVRAFEAKVAPANYKRPAAVVTPKMVEDALKTIDSLGLTSALERRHARIEDVSVNNVLWVNNDVRASLKGGTALSDMLMSEATKKAPVKASASVVDIDIDDFMATVLPKTKELSVQLNRANLANFVSLTTSCAADAGRLFKWDNNFAWSYDGDVADSIKERVKRAGGNIDVPLRVSLSWFNFDDLDIEAACPDGHVSFRSKMGILDVDMNAGSGKTRDAVENLAWKNPRNGTYDIYVNQFSRRESIDVGFVIELENNGTVQQFAYNQMAVGKIKVMSFEVKNGVVGKLSVAKSMVSGQAPAVEKWGISTDVFVPVKTVMFSPNFWDDNTVGNKHWFFVLHDCLNPDPVRGIYNEFLRPDLDKYRKVFELIGHKAKSPASDSQLSGVGFSSTVPAKLLVKTDKRMYNVMFNHQGE